MILTGATPFQNPKTVPLRITFATTATIPEPLFLQINSDIMGVIILKKR